MAQDKRSTNMDSEQIARAMERTLKRYQCSLISLEQAKQELSLLAVALKAREQAVLEEKIDRLEAILEARNYGH
jgi:uncharacterized small protein (DUF1192 family)